MAAGMNWGILTLLAMILFVLGGVAAFFIFLARRSAAMAAEASLSVPLGSMAESNAEPPANDRELKHRPAAARFASVFAWRKKHCRRSESRLTPEVGLARSGNHG
jgi:hypothetical protein